ncbi:hypothetical protein [Pseudoalteromonas sp. P1-7a]|uniref:hypothetical protein n=1 Tax=Pseudoalteromonas sp. P1-7a TaxID=1723755 RepID=UPI0006D68AEC|nr:hypothetical protein [Pseudoalteromonas sp. P1-7a]KPZ58533.1 hypothetical protein AN389_02999 [Pseudoalteromonas sp. P1-7a]
MKHSIFILVLLALTFSLNVYSGVADEAKKLGGMISDQYSKFLINSLVLKESKESGNIIVTFAMEGFKNGNNVKEYLAIYTPEYKTIDEPPFTPIGEPKYRLIGFSEICSDRNVSMDASSISVRGKLLSGTCKSRSADFSQDQKFLIEVDRYSIRKKA